MHEHNKKQFEGICELIKGVDANGDSIVQTHQLRTISEKFRGTVKEEKQLRLVKVVKLFKSFS